MDINLNLLVLIVPNSKLEPHSVWPVEYVNLEHSIFSFAVTGIARAGRY